MGKFLVVILLLYSNISIASSKKSLIDSDVSPFFIYLVDCYKMITPKINMDIIGYKAPEKILKCQKISEDFTKCEILEKNIAQEQVFYSKYDAANSSITLSDKNGQTVDINTTTRIAISTQLVDSSVLLEISSCKGSFINENFIKKIKKIDLNKGMEFILSEVKNEGSH